MLTVTACGTDDDAASDGAPTPSPSVSPSQTPTPSTATPPPTPTASASPILLDGRHPVFVTDVDAAGRTVTFDLIQFLTGEAAKEAYTKDHPDDPDGPPNDYYIVNENPRLRTLPVVAGVEVTVLWLGGDAYPEQISFEELPGYLAAAAQGPFWLTVDDGDIFAMEEQFIP